MNIKTKAHTESFSAKYTVHMPAWYKSGEDIHAAIELEKKLKTEREPGLYGFRDYHGVHIWPIKDDGFCDYGRCASLRRMTFAG